MNQHNQESTLPHSLKLQEDKHSILASFSQPFTVEPLLRFARLAGREGTTQY